jgi:enoyl-CoA hydratase/carnithine racemase
MGLVSEVYPEANFRDFAQKHVDHFSKLPPKSLMYSKELMRPETKRNILKEVNKNEVERLRERVTSQEAHQAIQNFLMKKKK